MPSRRLSFVAWLAGGIVLGLGTPASAVTIDFNILWPPTGHISYDGMGGPLLGSDIVVDTVTGTGTPDHAGTYNCILCRLNFRTGEFIAAGPSGWLFGAHNEDSGIAVTGLVDTDGNGTGDLPLFMLGTFIGPQVAVELATVGEFDYGFTIGFFLDFKNPKLADFFGVPTFPWIGGFDLGWKGNADPPGGEIDAQVTNGVVRNTLVPEPATILLLGVGLAGLGAARRRAVRRYRRA